MTYLLGAKKYYMFHVYIFKLVLAITTDTYSVSQLLYLKGQWENAGHDALIHSRMCVDEVAHTLSGTKPLNHQGPQRYGPYEAVVEKTK